MSVNVSEFSPQSVYDREIERVLRKLEGLQVESKEYAECMRTITELYKLKEIDKPRSEQISKETWLMVAVNLMGILLVIRHEHVNIITSRAMGLIPKLNR